MTNGYEAKGAELGGSDPNPETVKTGIAKENIFALGTFCLDLGKAMELGCSKAG